MRMITSTLVVAGMLAGIAGAVLGYQAVTAAPDQRPVAGQEQATPAPPAAPPRVRLLPCERGWSLRGQTCVRVVTKFVAASTTPAASTAAPAYTQAPTIHRATTSPRPSQHEDSVQASGPSSPSHSADSHEPSDDGPETGD